jgi:hypothetical protein
MLFWYRYNLIGFTSWVSKAGNKTMSAALDVAIKNAFEKFRKDGAILESIEIRTEQYK